MISDTTGYGIASVNAYVPMLKEKGARSSIRTISTRPTPTSSRNAAHAAAGAEAIMPERQSRLPVAHHQHTRADGSWDVPIVGQTTLGSGQTRGLLEKPEYRAKVYPNNFRPVSYANGKLTDRTAAFVDRLKAPISSSAIRCCGGSRSAMTRRA